jgi:diketogulonate reductase-like aldo/keto reductase
MKACHEAINDREDLVHQWRVTQLTRLGIPGPLPEAEADHVDWALRPVAERHGVTPAAVAVAWPLAFPGVTGSIVGARRPLQVDGWLPAATLELKDGDLSDIAAIGATGAGSGPASPATAIR